MVNVPVLVPAAATQFVVGLGDVPQQVPRSVMVAPPSDDTVPPSVTVESVIDVAVGDVTVGVSANVVNVASAEYDVPTLLVA